MLAAMSDLDPQPAAFDEVADDDAAQSSGPAVASAPAHVPAVTVELTAMEARVVGSLVEKSFLTPDVYPMTTNALASACNQKTNRDPVVDYSAVQIDAALMELRQRNLVRRVHTPGSRSTKHRQTIDEVLSLDEQELALLSVLLLRGPQTVGELRLRTERHEVGFDDLETVEATLERLASRARPIVEQLPRQPGHKENRWQHLLLDDAGAPTPTSAPADAPIPAPQATSPAPEHPTARPGSDREELLERIDRLETRVARLQAQLHGLAESLGETLE